jgi:aminoacyl tRNA synthase complex-interacting multifunctional protein 1
MHVQKKKESVQPHLKTDDSCMAVLGVEHFITAYARVVAFKSPNNANIS